MSTAGISGQIHHLRISDSGAAPSYGPPDDRLTTEVVVVLEGSDRYFGFELQPGPNLPSRLAMLAAVRNAFFNGHEIGFLYSFEDGKKASRILRLDLER